VVHVEMHLNNMVLVGPPVHDVICQMHHLHSSCFNGFHSICQVNYANNSYASLHAFI